MNIFYLALVYTLFFLSPVFAASSTAWQATDAYRNQDYAKASVLYKSLNTADGYYNQGNAEAKQGHYQEALTAYQQSLSLRPNDEDTLYNKALIEKLLKQQQQQQQQQNTKNKNKKNKKNKKNQENQENQKKQQKNHPAQPQQTPQEKMEQQFLNMVPDDPGGLLKQKFLRDHLRRLQGETL